jgi:hypothetical protein
MARAFLRENDRYVALLEDAERAMIASLMEQTRLILSPEVESTGDAFDDLVASMGVSLAAEDQVRGASAGLEKLDEADSEDLIDRDPALDRLLPTAHRGDDQIAAEFRRLTEEGLRQRKSANLDMSLGRLVAADGERLELDGEQAAAFLMALTDVRLLLGERMGMRTEEDAEALQAAMGTIADDEPIGYAMAVYDFLTWLQESLTLALMGPEDGPLARPRSGLLDASDDGDDDDADEAP